MSAAVAPEAAGRRAPLVRAGLALGVGLGGFFDGILLHQILQWHNMLASVLVPTDLVSMKVNMFWDGLFHAFTWIVTVAGLALLFAAARRALVHGDVRWSGRLFVGALLAGWGLFNFVEGLVDHQLLGLHHVRPGPGQLAWDLGFLASGLVLFGAGAALMREAPGARPVAGRRRAAAPA